MTKLNLSAKAVIHDINIGEFERMGAKVVDFAGVMTFVKFTLHEVEISFIYHLNKDDSYFLERIRPYSMEVGDFPDEESIIAAIRVDIEQFRLAMERDDLTHYININRKVSRLTRIFEDLFLYYDLNENDLGHIETKVNDTLAEIKLIQQAAPRTYTKKEPDVLDKPF